MFLILWLVRRLAILALLLAIPLVVGELVARKLVGDAVRSQVMARFGGAPSVGFGSTPLLLQLVEGHINVNMSDTQAAISGLPPVSLTASFSDIRLTSLLGVHGVIGSVSAQASLGPAGVRDLLATSGCITALPATVAADLTDHPRVRIARGRVTLLPPHGRAVVVRVVPSAVGNKVDFNAASRAGGAPAGSAACVASLGSLPFALALDSATAEHGSLDLALAGRGARFTG